MNCNWKTVASLFSNSSQQSQGKREGAKEGNRHKDKTQKTENLPITYIQKLKWGGGGLGTRKTHLNLHFKLLEMGIQSGLA